MESKLKPLLNEVDVVGRVKEVNLETGVSRKGKENIKGNVIIQVAENVNGEARLHDIRVRVYSNKFKADGTINGLYTGYETVMNEYKSIAETGNKEEADLVHVQGSLELNEFIGRDGSKHSNNQVNGRFFNRIEKDDVKKLRGPKAVVNIEAVVDKIVDVMDADGLPSNEKKLKAFNVDFFGELRDTSQPIIPFEAIVSEDLADAFDSLYDEGETGKFTLKINNYAEEATEEDVQEVSGFGNTEELKQVKRSFVNNLELIGGTEPYVEPKAFDEEQIKEIKQWRQRAIQSLEDGYTPQPTPQDNAFGQGSKKDDVDDDDLSDLDF